MSFSESRRLQTGNRPMRFVEAREYRQTQVRTWLRKTWVGEWVRACRKCRQEFWAWARCRQVTLPTVEHLSESIAVLGASTSEPVGAEKEAEAPIFLLSTGWRTGSTLLQRILVTDPRLLLWGEPLGEMALVSRITEMVSQSISARNLRLWRTQSSLTSSSLAQSWIANLYPSGDDFRLALRSLFDQWLGVPARESGFARWGIKEVRLGASEASLLHWLYPYAKFVVLSRHPYDCYRSLADSGWQQVYHRHPDMPIDSAASFARHWNRLVLSWSELPSGFPSFHLKYEDLISGKVDFRKLESWLGIEIKENVALKVSIGGTAKRSRLSWYERLIIAHEAEPGMRALGYSK